MWRDSVRSLVLVASFFLFACSSSDSGVSLPEVAVDDSPPSLLLTVPFLEEDEFISPNSSISFLFDELLDPVSVQNGVEIYSVKNRDIYRAFSGSDVSAPVFQSDRREFDMSMGQSLVTVSEDRLVSESLDEDGALIRVTESIDVERLATTVFVTPKERLNLNANYIVTFDTTVKDLSIIDSINPVTRESTNGNFLVEALNNEFKTDDGQWRPVTRTVYDDPDFTSLMEPVYTVINGTGLGVFSGNKGSESVIYTDLFDLESQQFVGAATRLDYIASLDGPSAVGGQISNIVATEGRNDAACVAWSQSAGLNSDIFIRCMTDRFSNKVTLNTIARASFSHLNIKMNSLGEIFVSYLSDGDVFFHSMRLDVSSFQISSISSDSVSLSGEIYSLSVSDLHIDNSLADLFVLSDDTSAPAVSRYQAHHISLNYGNSISDSVVREITLSEQAITSIEGAIDIRGTGVAIVNRAFQQEALLLSAFDGFLWNSPEVVETRTANVVEFSLGFLEDGQAYVAWVSENSGVYSVRAQARAIVDGVISFSRTPIIELDSSVSSLQNISLLMDREGNGTLVYEGVGQSLSAIRYRHNEEWFESFGDVERLQVNVSGGDYGIYNLAQDGRHILLYTDSRGPHPLAYSRLFSDYD